MGGIVRLTNRVAKDDARVFPLHSALVVAAECGSLLLVCSPEQRLQMLLQLR